MRKAARTSLQAEVSIRRAGQHSFRVRIYDASPYGCRVEFVERPRLDEIVWVRFEGIEPIEGSVCWVDGMVGGVEFQRPIHPAVFDRLVGLLR